MGTNNFAKFIDDLLWLYAWVSSNESPDEDEHVVIKSMIKEYTDNIEIYSDGSYTGTQYIPDDIPNVILYQPFRPSHRKQCSCGISRLMARTQNYAP